MGADETRDLFPAAFGERLRRILPEGHRDEVWRHFSLPEVLSVRVNMLKADVENTVAELRALGIEVRRPSMPSEALILPPGAWTHPEILRRIEEGRLFRQRLSSMLPVVVLDVRPGQRVLDLCAAPGAKTTQMAARMENVGRIVAVERVRGRYYRLRALCVLQGTEIVEVHCLDARRFRSSGEGFDRVLLDAPCSSEGRFRRQRPETYRYWSPRKIKEMSRKQRGLIQRAWDLLAPGGVLVYATCTFAPEENEGIVDTLIRRNEDARTEPVTLPGVPLLPALHRWEDKAFHPGTTACVRVLPGAEWDGFFIARIRKRREVSVARR